MESDKHRLTELEAGADAVGKPLSAIRDEQAGLLVLGLVHEGTFVLGIGEDPVVASGDHLLIAEPARKEGPARRRSATRRPAGYSGRSHPVPAWRADQVRPVPPVATLEG